MFFNIFPDMLFFEFASCLINVLNI